MQKKGKKDKKKVQLAPKIKLGLESKASGAESGGGRAGKKQRKCAREKPRGGGGGCACARSAEAISRSAGRGK